jgi:hypothetical protein
MKTFIYEPSVPNHNLQNDIGDDISRVLSNYKRPDNLIGSIQRDTIVAYVMDSKRAFNYSNSREPKKYIPYNIPKDAYDLFFYNYGFK